MRAETTSNNDSRPSDAAGIAQISVAPMEAIARIIRFQPHWLVRSYSRIRFLILRQRFLEEIGQYFPEDGEILDLGCGFGLFSLYYALTGGRRKVTGVDLNPRRIAMATACAAKLGVQNVEYTAKNALEWQGTHEFDAIYMLDLLHHLPRAEVPNFLKGIASLVRAGGVLIVKDVSPKPAYKRLFTLWLDRVMVGLSEPIYYWPPEDLAAVLRDLGFTVRQHTMNDILPYPHVLYVCHKPAQS